MKRRSLFFIGPRQIEVIEEHLPVGQAGEVLVETQYSAISSGTELMLYRGEAPAEAAADTTIKALSGTLAFPLKYGYAVVGRVLDSLDGRSGLHQDQLVFAFHPHESHFWTHPESLHPLPPHLPPQDAVFLPNMETAVSFLQDGRPILGEQVTLFGQGIVGLLTTALLAHTPISQLVTLDRYPMRRQHGLNLGANLALDPVDPDLLKQLQNALYQHSPDGKADLVFELSGQPIALQQAIDCTGFGGRLIIGSWYGLKPLNLELGDHFHRSQMRLISSQVSTIAPHLRGRWAKERRLELAWRWLARINPRRFVTHTLPISQAATAYHLLDTNPQSTLQVLLAYDT